MPVKTEQYDDIMPDDITEEQYNFLGEPEFAEEDKDKYEVDDRLQMLVTRAAEEALLWREEDLDFMQSKATDYYMGRPFGNEVKGRSRVVSTVVRDTIQAMLPSIMRIFFGPENVVEYDPRGPEDVQVAEQLTDMANYVIRNDNDGFLQIHGAMKDAMVRKLGVIKVWWEDSERTEGYSYTGLSEAALVGLEQEEGVELTVTESYPLPMPGSPEGFATFYDAQITREHSDGKVRFATIPSEEFIFSPEARNRDHAEMMGHVRAVPASELVAMGVDKELVDEHKGRVRYTNTGDDLAAERRFDQDQREQLRDERDEARDECWYGEIFLYANVSEEEDGEDDGTAPLIRCEVIGENHTIIDWDYCDERPFALFTCDPEPHTLVGLSVADYVMDIQLIKSSVLRGMLDSLTLSLNPRTVVSETEVNMSDVLTHEVGAIIRVERDVNAVKEFVHRFDQSGGAAFNMLEYLDTEKENRTGISKAAAGLDADALQSSTKAAVAATLSGAQQHLEMLARVFAETGFKQLYSLILKTLVKHQDQARTVRIRNEWTEMDPAVWHADMDVRINLALGAGSSEEKLQLLDLITNHQKQLLDEGSPLVNQVQYRAGLARMVELAGFPNADEFYLPWNEEKEQQFQQQKAQQPPQDPAIMAVQGQLEIEKSKLMLEERKVMMKDALDRAKAEMDFALRQATAEAQYGAQIDNQELMADQATAKAVIDAAAKEAVARQAGGAGGIQPSGVNSAGGGGQPTP